MPKVFGLGHILYLVITAFAGGLVIFLVKRKAKNENFLKWSIRISGIVFFIFILINRISIAVRYGDAIKLIPDSFCGFTSFFFSMVLIFGKKDNAALQFVSMVAIVSGAAASFYPDFLGQNISFFYLPTISGLLHHSMQVFCALLVLITRYVKPTMKRWAAMPIGLAFFMTYGTLLISAFGFSDAMQINKPLLAGTILTWYFLGALIIAVYTVALIIFDILTMPKEEQFFYKLRIKLNNIIKHRK